jgi:hypothetical protein
MVTASLTEIDCNARMLPAKVEPVSSVADEPTCQNTLHGWPPLITRTLEAGAVISVVAVLKTNAASGFPFKVSVPVMPNVPDVEL